ncbi:ankyrin [Hyaloscypha variabilis]
MPLKNWTEAQGYIHEHYVVQHQPLHRVRELMLRNGFNASIRTYRDKLKEWGYLRCQVRQQDLPLQLPISGAAGTQSDAALPSMQSAAGIFGDLPDFNLFSNSVPLPSESQGLWQNSSLHGSIPPSQFGQGNTSFASMSNSGASAFPILPENNDNGNNLNTRDSSGRTPLHQAVISRSLKDVEKYLSMGLAVDAQDDENNQPLHLAAESGSQDVIKLLLKHKADPNAKGKSGRTPLHMSIRFTKATREILKACPAMTSQDDNGDTPLHLALSSSTLDERPKGSAIQQLIFAGANVNALNTAQITPFHMMLEKINPDGEYHTDFVMMFLENEANVSLETKDGKYPFEVFLEKIGSRWYKTDTKTPSRKPNLDLKMFIAMKADIDITLKSGRTLLNEALYGGLYHKDLELCQFLLNTADMDKPDSDGNTPLHILSEKAWTIHVDTISGFAYSLIQRGANPNRRNRAEESPLIISLNKYFHSGCIKFAEMLCGLGANPMLRDLKGNLPIYYVARSDSKAEVFIRLMEVLLEASSSNVLTIDERYAPEAAPRDGEWWLAYRRFSQQLIWSYPSRLLDLTILMPNDVAETISKLALKLLATKFLQSAKADFDRLAGTLGSPHQDTQARGYQMVAILRDCLKLNIEVEQSWYHSLLDLFD